MEIKYKKKKFPIKKAVLNKPGLHFSVKMALLIISFTFLTGAGVYYYTTVYIYKDITESGHEYLKRKDYEKAIKAYSLEIEKNPGDPAGYYNRGTAYLNMREYDKAIRDINKSISINPEAAHFYINRGNAFFRKGDFKNSIQDNSKAVELAPDNAIAYYNRGRAYYHDGEFEKALKDFEKAYSMGVLQAKGLLEEVRRKDKYNTIKR